MQWLNGFVAVAVVVFVAVAVLFLVPWFVMVILPPHLATKVVLLRRRYCLFSSYWKELKTSLFRRVVLSWDEDQLAEILQFFR